MKITGDWIRADATKAVGRMLAEAGYQALFVGGCVRNALLNEPVRDIDISTDALPDMVMKLATDAGLKPIPTGLDHGTVTVVSEGIAHEITTFRKDVETFGRHAVVAFSTDVIDDARRRDFTMNALYAQPDGTVIDPLNGLPDLQARRFRFIEDADQRIQEDYLRILRFFRFNAWYGDPSEGLDADALAAIVEHVEGMAGLSRERVGAEVIKLLDAPDPVFAVAAMRSTGALNVILPGADDCALGPLVHLEVETDTAPQAIRRLAALGGMNVAERLRLSTAQSKELRVLKEMVGSTKAYSELGYRLGAEVAWSVALLKSAMLETVLPADAMAYIAKGAEAKFPLKAVDFQPEYEGPALGKILIETEQRWIDSNFALDRGALLSEVRKE